MISLILTALVATSYGSPATPGPSAATVPLGSYTFRSAVNGSNVGTNTVVVKSIVMGTEIDEEGSGQFQGMDASAKATLTLANDLTPDGYTSTYVVAGQDATATITFSNGNASLNSPTGPQAFALGSAKHFAVLDGALLAGFVALPAQMRAWSDAPVQAVAPMFGRAAVLSVDTSARPIRPTTVPAIDAQLSLVGPDAGTLWYNPTTFVTDEVDVPSQGLIVTRVR